ncbi:MAG: TIGR00730 family Rossman fold protein [Candidatus Omnitrophica bacterium]|nr:TIGR00730 family Rossman fold protein [Candidatus Omnitrophota bacterium]
MKKNGRNALQMLEEPWRVFRIMGEFVEGFEELSDVANAVAVFGSSKMARTNPYYHLATRIGSALVKAGYSVITGAGPGAMEAANKGASEAGGESIGLNIEIPILQEPNRFVKRLVNFRFFFIRRVMFVKYSKAFVFMPGGFGTLDELTEIVTLIQTKKLGPIPVILVGREFWQPLLTWLDQDVWARRRFLEPSDMGLFTVCDTPREVVDAIQRFDGAGRVRARKAGLPLAGRRR